MSVYDNMPVLDNTGSLIEFVAQAPPGATTAYTYGQANEVQKLAWQFACEGKVTLFKRRRELDAPFQNIMVRISPEAARKLGKPDYQREF